MKGGLTTGLLVFMAVAGGYEIIVDGYYWGGGLWLLCALLLWPAWHERFFGQMLWPAPASLGLFIAGFVGGLLCLQRGL